jgi:hypothetical protein
MIFIPYYEIDTPEKKSKREEDHLLRAIGERNIQVLKVCDAITDMVSHMALLASMKEPEHAT